MKKILETLWNEYLCDKCAAIDTDEERNLTKNAIALHEKVNALLNEEQQDVVEEYVDALYDIEDVSIRKAFFKGCEFAVSFLLEAGNLRK